MKRPSTMAMVSGGKNREITCSMKRDLVHNVKHNPGPLDKLLIAFSISPPSWWMSPILGFFSNLTTSVQEHVWLQYMQKEKFIPIFKICVYFNSAHR